MSLPGNKVIYSFRFSLLKRPLARLCFLVCLQQLFCTRTEKGDQRARLSLSSCHLPLRTAFFCWVAWGTVVALSHLILT